MKKFKILQQIVWETHKKYAGKYWIDISLVDNTLAAPMARQKH